MRWCVLYDNGTRYSDQDGSPDGAPPYGVLGIWQPDGRSLYNKDFYIWRDDYGAWIEVDQIGLVDHLVTAARAVTAVKVGRTVPWQQYRAVLDVMKALRP